MSTIVKRHHSTVSDQKWSISTFMEFYDRVLGPKLFEPYGELLVRTIRDELPRDAPIESVLEVACGTGRITSCLYRDLAKPLGLRLVATDLSHAAIEVCKATIDDEVRRGVELQAGIDMADLPYANDSFDVVVCGFGLMFPPDKAKVARELTRVLRPGGKIYGTVFHHNELFDLAREQSQRHFGAPSAILAGALSLSDHSEITNAFLQEGLCRGVSEIATLCPSSFFLDESDIREFLFNSFILLEEFNQCDVPTREAYLDLLLTELRARVPSLTYKVQAWLLRGSVDADGKRSVPLTPLPDFSELSALAALRPNGGAAPPARLAGPAEACAARYDAMKAEFLGAHPEYVDADVEALRRTELSRLDAHDEAYLDHVGGALAPESLIDHSHRILKQTIFGNPHTGSKASEEAYERARAEIYRFFRCTPDEYEIVFTPNASAAIRLVAESFPFGPGSELILSKDNHTSVHGIREFAKSKGAFVRYIPLTPDMLIVERSLQRALDRLDARSPHLLAFPAQSNASGALHDLQWIRRAHDRGAMVLCDAAAIAPLSGLDVGAHQPDFVCLSFYKIFGYPTGVGCLLARRAALERLAPPSFAGGAVCYFSGPWSPTERTLHHRDGRRFEIGTPNYTAFHSIAYGFELIAALGLPTIRARAVALARWLESELMQLRHEIKGKGPLCRIYGPAPERKGATIMLNLFDSYGSIFPHALVHRAASRFGITVRNGCFCNLGAVQHATYTTAGSEHCELDKNRKVLDCATFDDEILSKGSCGAVRVSLGLGSTFRDAYRFYAFARALVNTEASRLADYLAPAAPLAHAS
jgi:selenocysteine lyase/cysteine desulfurase/ubiquinone/menaquinone biosynthesis C-methylase UbiE